MTPWHGSCYNEHMAKTAPPPSNYRIAELLDVDHSTISRLRSGDRVPSLTLIYKISRVYGLGTKRTAELVADVAAGADASAAALSKIFESPLPVS